VTYGLRPPELDRAVELFATPARAMPSWTLLAKCSQYDDWELFDALFFPSPSGTRSGEVGATNALTVRRICATCPVRAACLRWGLEAEEDIGSETAGVWGGILEQERRATRGLPFEERVRVLTELFAEKVVEVLAEGESVA
jgi:hypothetical protein